ncbi:hypothetical protein A1O3_05357 [Capronia epimyces CBS 606.96]|uniref:Uncharacterized protein n=1 Tax=Capronia epimyces CBS 606.96 TaxID=1182542 RepID=W9XVT5_9EURO|nr:uncharacterized protein A1O3_05357 [Capronia epimyces CBS 606.96]EXJ84687.1 hypothetical protein A1O3_05357 [Capronia epimyces CBS 606.96]
MDALLTRVETISSTLHSQLPPHVQPYLTRENLQSFLRLVVLLATYLLFRPHLESLMRKISGKPDPRQAEIEARLAFLKKQREGTVATTVVMPGTQPGDGAKRNTQVVARDGKIVGLVKPEEGGQKSKGKNAGKNKSKKSRAN